MSHPRFHNHRQDDGPCYLERVHKCLERGAIPTYSLDCLEPGAVRYHKQGKLTPRKQGPAEL